MRTFKLIKQKGNLRIGEINIRGKKLPLPFYFPVGTVGAVKSVAPWEIKDMGFKGILANTYHLYLRPGEKLIRKAGGLHKFMGWPGVILTDSGGFQVFSLRRHASFSSTNRRQKPSQSKTKNSVWPNDSAPLPTNQETGELVKIKSDGVEFTSHIDGSKHFFTPKKVIDIQLALGSDIIMPLDICPPGQTNHKNANYAAAKSLEWLKIAKTYFDKKMKNIPQTKRPLLFGIIQGGTYLDLRQKYALETIKLNLDGYAIGGLAVGEEKTKMWKVVKLINKILPRDLPRYLMGVGEPDDFIKAINLGIDFVDCVLPTRLARHGIIYKLKTKNEKRNTGLTVIKLDLRKKASRENLQIIDKNCSCLACVNGLSIAYLAHLIKENEILGHRLASIHNLATIKRIIDHFRSN